MAPSTFGTGNASRTPVGAEAALGFPISGRARYPAGLTNFRPNDRGGSRISRRAVIYCRSGTAREERAVVGRLRTVATKQGWTVIKAFVDRPGAGRAQWAALRRALAAREADLLMVPSFAGMGRACPMC